jgi:ADP-heptose:LPS heptosyltransferase
LWPGVEVIPFVFPWTAFKGKYQVARWPWTDLKRLFGRLRSQGFDIAVSARWDPRDHVVLALSGAKRRLGFPRVGSALFLNKAIRLSPPRQHRYEHWRALGRELGIDLPPREHLPASPRAQKSVLIHSGAAQPLRVWPLERFQALASRLRQTGYSVRIICDKAQREWWASQREDAVVAANISELMAEIDRAGLFIGNDSGPGHLAAIMGAPTFTIFGNSLPGLFGPLHPQAAWIEGAPCPYKPCFDACRFPQPNCLLANSEAEVWAKLQPLLDKAAALNAEPSQISSFTPASAIPSVDDSRD